MKSFLVRGKRPIILWSVLPDNCFFEGNIPEGYKLAVCPSEGMIVIDIDKHGKKNGFTNIPPSLMFELKSTLNYPTKNNGRHFWFKYTGDKPLANKTSNLGIDLRTHKGYVVYYPDNDIRDNLHLIKESSNQLNVWLKKLFSYIDNSICL